MESKDWSGFGYFSPDLEKIKQLVVCSKHQNTWEDTGNVVKVFFSIQSKKKNVRQWKETEFSTPFVVKAATSLLLNSLKFIWKAVTSFMLPDYNCNSENFENISGQFGFLLLPRRFPCAVAVNKYLHRISSVSWSVRMFRLYFSISRSKLPGNRGFPRIAGSISNDSIRCPGVTADLDPPRIWTPVQIC